MGFGMKRRVPRYCELCGTPTPLARSVSGWTCCPAHLRAPKPDFPVFDERTGERLPDGVDPKEARRARSSPEVLVDPIAHLDDDLEIDADDRAALALLDEAALASAAERAAEQAERERRAGLWHGATSDELGSRWVRHTGPEGSPDPTRDEQTDSDGFVV